MANERPNAYHVYIQVPEEADVLSDALQRLPRKPHDVTRSHLKSHLSEVLQAAEAIFIVRVRVKPTVKLGIGGFVLQKISIGAGFSHPAVFISGALPHTKGDGHIHKGFDPGDKLLKEFHRVVGILTGLENHGSVAQLTGPLDALQNFLQAHPVTGTPVIVTPQAAVVAVLAADVGEFDETPQVDGIPYVGFTNLIGCPEELLLGFPLHLKEAEDFLPGEGLAIQKGLFDEGVHQNSEFS